MKYVSRDHQADLAAPLGGKAPALAALRVADLPIPAWFVVHPEAFNDSLSAQHRLTLDKAPDSATLSEILDELRPSAAVEAELVAALAELCPDGRAVAVR